MSSLEYCSCSYSDLPLEIILYIYKYLDYSDLQAAGATCRRWHDALDQTEFHARTRVRFTKVLLSDHSGPALDFLKCDRQFRHFAFEDVTIDQVPEFMTFIGRNAHSLALDNVDLTDKQFYGILRMMSNLSELSVSRCSSLFMSGTFLDSTLCSLNELTGHLTNVKQLTIAENPYLTDAILLRLTSLMSRLELINMTGCHIAFHNAIHRRFYPNETYAAPSESVLTFKYVLSVLKKHREHLRVLNFSQTLIGQAILALCDLGGDNCNSLQLEQLYLAGCRQLNTSATKRFLSTQSQLTVLDLSGTLCLNDDCLSCIVQFNGKLQHLKINACMAVTNVSAVQLRQLKYLRVLDISNCDNITSHGIIEGIAREENNVLEELNISYLQICEECVKAVASNLRALRSLHLNHCVNGVTDEALQCIIGQLRWLRELSLEYCCQLTDAALTGIDLSKLERNRTNSQASSMDNFYPPLSYTLAEHDSLASSLQSVKISLRSKAEEEIVRDAKRKEAMFAAYELNLIDEDFNGHNIQQLRGLRSLNLRGCNKISDVSLKYGMKHIELKQLLLSNCQQISLIGMESLVNNCPSIEELDLSDCYNINDKAIKVITTKLRRLRVLNISGCSQLTDHTIDAILINCVCLQTLSVYRCRSIYTDIEDRLSSIRTLRNLNMDNVASLDNADFLRLKKRLDY